jgi:hypothetical protein
MQECPKTTQTRLDKSYMRHIQTRLELSNNRSPHQTTNLIDELTISNYSTTNNSTTYFATMVNYCNPLIALISTLALASAGKTRNLSSHQHGSNAEEPSASAAPSLAPVAAAATNPPTISESIRSRCAATEIAQELTDQNFNDGRWDGWTNGRSEQSERDTYGLFLGRYERGDSFPHRDFVLPASSQRMFFQYDFLEIDSWDGLGADGPDTAGIKIEGDEGIIDMITFGGFDFRFEAESQRGITNNGIVWEVISDSWAHSPQGFLPEYQDQRHRVTIEVPSQFYSDNSEGTLRVAMLWTLNGEIDESIGFGNFSPVACEDTTPSAAPSMTPSVMPSSMPTIDNGNGRIPRGRGAVPAPVPTGSPPFFDPVA